MTTFTLLSPHVYRANFCPCFWTSCYLVICNYCLVSKVVHNNYADTGKTYQPAISDDRWRVKE